MAHLSLLRNLSTSLCSDENAVFSQNVLNLPHLWENCGNGLIRVYEQRNILKLRRSETKAAIKLH